MEKQIVKITKFFSDLTSKTPDIETFQINFKPKGKDFTIEGKNLTPDDIYKEYLSLLKKAESEEE